GILRANTIRNEMNKLLKCVIVQLMFKIDWRKLFLILAIITLVGILLQISLLPFPLSTWLHSPLVKVSTAKELRSPLLLTLRHDKHWPLHQISFPVPLNSSSGLTKEVHSLEKGSRPSRRRRRRKGEDEIQIRRYVWSLSPNQALLYAKKELKNAPFIANDTDLYAPIFKNEL
ncbi:putative membrane protein YndJ, partial [Bienertia sinuspersici]